MTDETPKYMYYATDNNEDGIERVEVTPALLARIDQERAAVDDVLNSIITLCVMDTLFDHLGDVKRRERNASDFSQALLCCSRTEALGLITVAAETLGAYYVNDKGGVEATLKQIHDQFHSRPRDEECPFPKLHEE